MASISLGCCVMVAWLPYMYIVFNLGRGIMYDWFGSLAGLHVARGPCTFGSVALHLALAFLKCGDGIVYVWLCWLRFVSAFVSSWFGCLHVARVCLDFGQSIV